MIEHVIDKETGEILGEVEDGPVRSTAVARRPVAMADFLDAITSPAAMEGQKRLMQAYTDYCHAILDESDYQNIEGKAFKKKAAWRKLGRAFQVSTQITRREGHWEYDDEEHLKHYIAEYEVRATSPWGQYAESTGSCSTREERFYSFGAACPTCGGACWDNRDLRGAPAWKVQKRERGELADFTCKDKKCGASLQAGQYQPEDVVAERRPNVGSRSKAEHDVRATAETRATNRAISNLIAAGEVSAEEVAAPSGRPATEAPEASAPAASDPIATPGPPHGEKPAAFVPPDIPTPRDIGGSTAATAKQVAFIKTLLDQKDRTEDFARNTYARLAATIDRAEASALIAQLKALPAKGAAATAPHPAYTLPDSDEGDDDLPF